MSTLYPIAAVALLETVGRWAAWYVLLSLSLALFWIALVTAGRLYQRRMVAAAAGRTRNRLPRPPLGLRHWHRENDEFSRRLLRLDDSLGMRWPREARTPASVGRHESSLRAES